MITASPASGELAPVPTRASLESSAPGCSALSLFQANLLVAMLGGFLARRADGHPGPELMAQGWVLLRLLVEWEAFKAARVAPGRQAPREPG